MIIKVAAFTVSEKASHTRHSLNIKIIKKLYLTVQKGAGDIVCTDVTSSAASRDSAVKLTTDSYKFWVAH